MTTRDPCPYYAAKPDAKPGDVLAERSWNVPATVVGGYGRAAITVALRAGGIGDYAAYVAVDAGGAWTVDNGNKLPFEVAALAFPGLVAARYRP